MSKQMTIKDQIKEINQNGTEENIKPATPEQAFKAPKDKNRQDRILSASISLSLSAKTEFELMSYRVISQEQYTYNIIELVNQFQKLKNENS